MKFKTLLLFIIINQCTLVFSQETNPKSSDQFLFEDKNGKLITDPSEQLEYLAKQKKALEAYSKISSRQAALSLVPVQLCSNSGFEEFVNDNGVNVLKNFQYTVDRPLNPIQCKSSSAIANLGIVQYNPNNSGLMATTVPSNHIDEFIGNIDGFDQYCLKLNYKESSSTMTLVQTKRFKTDNENVLKFNYKAVLQSIPGSGHLNEQPYFKARIVNNKGVVVSEFCLTGDIENCIYTQAPVLGYDSIILYTKNWQSGTLDISSIPNNENFTIEFMTTRCGLGGHFGYSYIDDICMSHTDENLQGSIQLDPMYQSCPTSPIAICGDFTIPNSGNIKATVKSIDLKIYNSSNKLIHTTSQTSSLDLTNKRFCFDLDLAALPNTTTENYNVSASINYDIEADQNTCKGTSFDKITDDDANPGWDITFLNCDPLCTLTLETANLTLCDDDKNGKEFFDLTNLNSLVAGSQTGITFSYFTNITDASTDKNPISNFKNYDSSSTIIFVKAALDANCYKIIAAKLIVKNPSANITGVLNICSGSTLLTATNGASYLWASGETTQSINATQTGLYSVTVTDPFGCKATGEVTILPNLVAAQPTIKITQPNCFSTTGTISVTSPASTYSFDNGQTWGTDSEIKNVPIGTYFVKIRTVAGCESYAIKITIVSYLSPFPNYIKTSPKFCGDSGSITIITPSSYYSFDDGVTWTTSNTFDNLASGSYHIRIKDSFGCISNFNNVELNSDFLPSPNFTISNPYCSNLGSITVTTPAEEYSFDGGTVWQTSNTMSNLAPGSYVIKIKNKIGCTSFNTYAYLYDIKDIYPTYQITNAGCNTYASIEIKTLADLYSFDNGQTWSPNPILKNLNGGTNYQIIVQKGGTCNSKMQPVSINSYFRPLPNANDYEITLCDNLNDGSEIIDLTTYNSNLIQNLASYRFEYFTTLLGATKGDNTTKILNYNTCSLSNTNNTVYVKVISQYGCVTVVSLKFTFLDSPRIKMQDKYPLCVGKNIVIDAGSGYDSYLWPNGEITQTLNIVQDGNYWVNVTEKHGSLTCNSTKNFNIFLSNPATITSIDTKDWSHTENTISVFQTGLGDYEYSLDNITYQDSNTFTDILEGEHNIYVRDKFGCGTTIGKAYLLMYPKFFTPNGDGYNDTWKIKLSEFEVGLSVNIFDRFGKLVKVLANNNDTWDGKYNGIDLPSSDYWFVVTRANGTEHKGHFSIKR
ncbi:T9SS type B sorting domain-containing protein [Flavobacterium sp. WC2509]|uniref:T9SS type B sorting domain-containing protein n=1 Tax=Flavobacterium sp. WC2509 TaxID=3461406 RepID=UPI0040450A63